MTAGDTALASSMGVAAGFGLFALLARERPRLGSPNAVIRSVLTREGFAVLTAALLEEALWRGVGVGLFQRVLPIAVVIGLSVCGFALAHLPRQGWHGVSVHVATGGVFVSTFLVGGLVGAATAHAAYNLCILRSRHGRPLSQLDMARVDTLTEPATYGGIRGGGRDRLDPVMDVVAELRNAEKSYGPVRALAGLSLEVRAGEVLALLGPNGAGKTTAVSLLLGLRRPDRGEALLFGSSPRRRSARARVGVALQDVQFPSTLEVGELISLVRAHYPAPRPEGDILRTFGLERLVGRQTGGLSGGEKRKLAAALAFAGAPELAFLDEPTAGLDIEARRDVWDGMRRYVGDGGTVVLTTHYLEEVEALASRVVVLVQGRIAAEGSVAELRARSKLRRVRLGVPPPTGLSELGRLERDERGWTLLVEDLDAALRVLIERGMSLRDIEIAPASLEEAFLAISGGDR